MISIIKRYFQAILPTAAAAVTLLLIISRSAIASDGIRQAIAICASVIIPSLFPFMVFSTFVVKSGAYAKIGRIIGSPVRLLFNLPPCASGAVIIGLLGGYPIGTSMAAHLFRIGAIDKSQARRLACFSVNAGPAFIISAVGEAIYQSKEIGYILFASVMLSSITIGASLGIISRIKGECINDKKLSHQKAGFINAFVSATESASKSMLSICVWVVTFSITIAFIKQLPLSSSQTTILCAITEVTSGCTMAAGSLPICATAAFISFGGVCVLFQILPNVREIGMKLRGLLLSRLISAALSFIYCKLILLIFPISSQVFSNGTGSI